MLHDTGVTMYVTEVKCDSTASQHETSTTLILRLHRYGSPLPNFDASLTEEQLQALKAFVAHQESLFEEATPTREWPLAVIYDEHGTAARDEAVRVWGAQATWHRECSGWHHVDYHEAHEVAAAVAQ